MLEFFYPCKTIIFKGEVESERNKLFWVMSFITVTYFADHVILNSVTDFNCYF